MPTFPHSPYACRPQSNVTDILAVNIGSELLKIVPGRVSHVHLSVPMTMDDLSVDLAYERALGVQVSTECDAHLSYDTQATIDKVS